MSTSDTLEQTVSPKDKKPSTKLEKLVALLKIIHHCARNGYDSETVKGQYAQQYLGTQNSNNRAEFTERKKEAEEMLDFLCNKKRYITKELMPAPGSAHITVARYHLTEPLGNLLKSLAELV